MNGYHKSNGSQEGVIDGQYIQEPVAIVGVGCRFPGDSDSPSALWSLLENNRSGFKEFPEDRFNVNSFYNTNRARPGSLSVRGGYFLNEDIRNFDPGFFGIRADQVTNMDPLQRKLLETAFEAIDSSGSSLEETSGSSCGVYVANFTTDWADMLGKDAEYPVKDHSLAYQPSLLSNRMSHCFNLKGPSLTLNTACSGSLYALHMACNALQAGECESALVGGANLTFSPDLTMTLSHANMLSPSSKCNSFDDSADGYGRGDGVAVLYLKKLSEALKNNDPIRGVIRGTAVTANGKTPGVTHPSADGQKAAILAAYKRANLDPEDTIYVECHGTGTAVGDPIEVSALKEVFKNERSESLLIGSIKTNIGHTEATSGIAGVIKAILALENNVIPATLGLRKLSTNINWNNGLKVCQENTSLLPRSLRRASINSFGYGGANAHCIVEAIDSILPEYRLSQRWVTKKARPRSAKSERKRFLVTVSGHDDVALEGNIASVLKAAPEYDLLDLSHTLSICRSKFALRSFAIMDSERRPQESDPLASSIFSLKGKKPKTQPKIAFIFTGQGAQWHKMAKELLQEFPSFLQTIRRLDHALSKVFKDDGHYSWTLEDALADKGVINIDDPAVAQPLCTAIQISIVTLLNTWGISPVATAGHSSGEIAAAFAAGLLTDLQAIVLAYVRGLCAADAHHDGAMLAVGLGAAGARSRIDSNPVPGVQIAIACINSPQSVTLSGDSKAIAMAEYYFNMENVFTRRLKIGKAYHSEFMKSVGERYERDSTLACKVLASQCLQERACPRISMISSVTTKPLGERPDVSYWRQNLESPVLFSDAVTTLLDDTELGVDKLVEIGPHSGLAGPIRQILAARSGQVPEYLPSLKRKEDSVENLLSLAGKLYLSDYPVDLQRINSRELIPATDEKSVEVVCGRFIVDLPRYSYNYSTLHWSESRLSKEWRFRRHERHDILGSRLPGTSRSTHVWRNILCKENLPWLADHKIAEGIVFPAAGYMAMAIEACCQIFEDADDVSNAAPAWFRSPEHHGYEIRNMNIYAALAIEEADVETTVELKALEWTKRSRSSTAFEFTILSLTQQGKWTENASGVVEICAEASITPSPQSTGSKEHTRHIDTGHYYEALRSVGLNYGPSFASLSGINNGSKKNTATGTTSLVPTRALMPTESRYILHPATIDTCLHLAMCAVSSGNIDEITGGYLPVSAEKIFFCPPSSNSEVITATARTEASKIGLRSISINSSLHDEAGVQLLQINNLRLSSIGTKQVKKADRNPYYRIEWRPDLDYLSQRTIERVYAYQLDVEEVFQKFDLLDRLTYLCMVEASEASSTLLNSSKPEYALPYHLQKFQGWIKTRISNASHETESGPSVVKGISSATSAERVAEITHITKSISGNVEAQLVLRVYSNLSEILSGKISTIDLLAQDGSWVEFQKTGLTYRAAYTQLRNAIQLLAHKVPNMEILEIGGGTGGTTRIALDALKAKEGFPRYKSYNFTDISTGFFPDVQEEFRGCPNMQCQLLDLNEDPIEQGFHSQKYDLIIASNVIHATNSLVGSLKRVKSLLKPTGKLLLLETTFRGQVYGGFVLGGLPGWWVGEADGRKETAVVTKKEWMRNFVEAGFTDKTLVFDDYPAPYDTTCTFIASAGPATGDLSKPASELLIVSRDALIDQAKMLEKIATGDGFKVTLGVLGNLDLDMVNRTVILLDTGRPILQSTTEQELRSLKNMFSNGNTVFWVTGGRNATPEYGANVGMSRVLRKEIPSIRLHTFDIDMSRKTLDEASDEIWRVFSIERSTGSWESMFDRIERDGVVHIDRVVPDHDLNTEYSRSDDATEMTKFKSHKSLVLDIENVGQLDTLYFKEDFQVDGPLLPEFVEVKVEATGVSWKDTMNILGYIDQTFFSCEASGVVTRIGSAVKRVQPGDRVVCVGKGNYGSFMYAHENGCVRAGDENTWIELATMPLSFSTAIYSLINLARLRKGDTVLVHTAAGGVGLAAIQIARALGAVLYVTVGSDAKKEFLIRKYDIPAEHIFYSRDTSFMDGIMKVTHGRGVDVVLNTLPNELLRASVNCLAVCGKLIEIGQRDILENGKLDLGFLSRSRTFSSFLIEDIITDQRLAETLDEMMSLLRCGKITPTNPVTVYDVSELMRAFLSLRNPNHIGKVVVTWDQNSEVKFKPITKRLKLRADTSYLLVGCLGGLGRSLVLRMFDRGARHFIFLSRSGTDKPEAASVVKSLRDCGASVEVVYGDVSNSADVDRAVREAKVPIRGVINAAMVLQDSYFETMDTSKLEAPLKPKVEGTLNLHNSLLAQEERLDFFVMTGSISGVTGVPGQANYAAANTFLDCFSTYRHSLGLPASSLDVGVVQGAGFVHDNPEIGEELFRFGYYGTSESEVLDAFEKAMAYSTPPHMTDNHAIYSGQLAIGLEPARFQEAAKRRVLLATEKLPMLERDPRLAFLAQSTSDTGGSEAHGLASKGTSASLGIQIGAKDPTEALEFVTKSFLARFSDLLALGLEEISESEPVSIYGMDSMVASGLRSWIFQELEVDISLLEFLSPSCTVHGIAVKALALFQARGSSDQNGSREVDGSDEVNGFNEVNGYHDTNGYHETNGLNGSREAVNGVNGMNGDSH